MKEKPLLVSRRGTIAVFPTKVHKTGAKYQTVRYEDKEGFVGTLDVFPRIGEYELSPAQILEIALRDVTLLKFGPHQIKASVHYRGFIKSLVEEDGEMRKQRVMNLGVAFRVCDESKFRCIGYNCKGLLFEIQAKDLRNGNTIELAPEDCFSLIEGKTLFQNGLMAKLLNKIDAKWNHHDPSAFVPAQLLITEDTITPLIFEHRPECAKYLEKNNSGVEYHKSKRANSKLKFLT